MYNSYSNKDFYYSQFLEPEENIVHTVNPTEEKLSENTDSECIENTPTSKNEKPNNSLLSNIFNNFKAPEFTTETLILIGVIYFSIYDELDWDLIIIIGVLYLIGL